MWLTFTKLKWPTIMGLQIEQKLIMFMFYSVSILVLHTKLSKWQQVKNTAERTLPFSDANISSKPVIIHAYEIQGSKHFQLVAPVGHLPPIFVFHFYF